jgi:chemotaxis protein CheD
MTNVRMGEIAVSSEADAELMALGLGSCIGLAVVDRLAGVAGLAHIVLPESRGDTQITGKFADLAVPDLLSRLRAKGAVAPRMEVAIAGGARMFALEAGMDVGARNEEAVRAQLRRAGIRVRAAHTGGEQGRTLRLNVGSGRVTVRMPGAEPIVLLEGRGAKAGSARAAGARGAATAKPAPRLMGGLS